MGTAAPLVLLLVLVLGACATAQYYGKPLGSLSELHHGVRGRVYAVDARTLYLQDFHYDGEGPAAYFYVGKSGRPSAAGGVRLRDERGGAGPLRRYRGEGAALALPDGLTLKDIRWFSVWCDEFSVNFGDVSIPADVEYPRPARAGALRGVHGVASDPVVVVDAQTLLVPNFSYDGEAPDAKFWVGRGEKPSPAGIRIPDENGKEAPLRRYDKKTIVLTLPGELTVFDIGHFGVWCEAFTVNFGHITLPAAQLANVPPSLKMLGVSPQSKLNCEVLFDELAFEVRWAVAGDSIVLQLVAKLEDGEYMSFGISGHPSHSQMVGADVAVAWVDKATLKGYAHDYYLDAKSQCAGVRGSCPDDRLGEKTNSIRLLNAALVNGYSIVTYQRSLKAADELDLGVLTNASQPVVWALGPLNSRAEVSYHHHFTKGDRFIEFGRPPLWNCPMPDAEDEPRPPPAAAPAPATRAPQTQPQPPADVQTPPGTPPGHTAASIRPRPVPTPRPVPRVAAWDIPPIQCHEPPDGVFYAQMGPTGGKQGYPAITGHVGWGISWYINGLLIPEITVVRGKKYTFVVEGGSDADTPARYHPFYITNDPVGGYYHKTDEEKKGVEIYAGVRRSRSGALVPSGVGRLCNWTPDEDGPPADQYPSFGAYQRSLTLVCEAGNPGLVTWTPDARTPDTVYYQCYTHRYLGWKINVVDSCDEGEGDRDTAAESRVVEVAVSPTADRYETEHELQQEESHQVPTRLAPPTPTSSSLADRKKLQKIINTKPNDFSSDRTAEPEPEVVSRGQIRDVIHAVEQLELDIRRRNVSNVHQYREPVRQHHQHQHQHQHRPHQYMVHEEPERALGAPPAAPGAGGSRPATLQSVMRPRLPPPLHPPRQRPPPPGPYKHYKPMYQNNRSPMKPLPHSKPYVPPKMIPKRRPPPPPPQQQQPYPMQTIIMGKPASATTLSVGRTDMMADQVVHSHMTLPAVDAAGASSAVHSSAASPTGQIILGKPMDHPVPLDQQMTPTRHHVITAAPAPPSSTRRPRPSEAPQGDIKSSDFMGESPEPSTLRPAVNTGFKPNTIVIESGFKPIIREPLMERRDEYSPNAHRREDTDVEDEYDEVPQQLTEYTPPQAPQSTSLTFEPMFIPSPPDLLQHGGDTTREVFPKNHAKEDRPHPVYVKTESELNALFGKKNMEKEVPADMVMESDRVSPQYLPPDPKLPKEHSQKLSEADTFTTYDGKTVSAATLISISDSKSDAKIFSSKLPAPTELLLKTPQFGPFKGKIPPAVAGSISKTTESDTDGRTTHLKLVNTFNAAHDGDLKAEGSDVTEARVEVNKRVEGTTAAAAKSTILDSTKSDEEYEDEELPAEDDDDMRIRMRQARDVSDKVHPTNQIDFQAQSTASSLKSYSTSFLLALLLFNLFCI